MNQEVKRYEPDLKKYLKECIGAVLENDISQMKEDENLINAGLDSLLVFDLIDHMKKDFKDLKSNIFFEYNTIEELSAYFFQEYEEEVRALFQEKEKRKEHRAKIVPDKEETRQAVQSERRKKESLDIAIIGIAGRYPQADDISSFWDVILNGKECITEIPEERWEQDRVNWKGNQWGGFINGAGNFDYPLFHMTKEQAKQLDPQLRVMMEVVWSALEDAGYPYQSFSQKKEKVGTFIGNMYGGFGQSAYQKWADGGSSVPQSAYWMIPNRISYFYDFKGPSIAVDSACSSSLTALHLACQSIYDKECSVAVVGGINLILNPMQNVRLDELGQLCRKGKTKSFSEDADGYVEGEGAGAFIIKPLKSAIEDGDYIYGVIKETICNHNGETADFMVPNIEGEAEILQKAIGNSGIDADTLTYMEAHAAGTKIGDAIEVEAMTRAFRDYTNDKGFCAIGTVKANVGHLESAAGICAVTKVLLQMRYQTLVPSIYCEDLNREIDLSNTPFYINACKKEWKPVLKLVDQEIVKQPLRAAVCSFGAGGSNSVVILESYQNDYEKTQQNREYNFVFSAKTEASLFKYLIRFKNYLIAQRDEIISKKLLPDIAFTLSHCRIPMEKKIVVKAYTVEELLEKLTVIIEQGMNDKNLFLNDSEVQIFAQDNGTFHRLPLPAYCFEQYELGLFPDMAEQKICTERTVEGGDIEVSGHISNGKPTLLGMALCSEMFFICNQYACRMNVIRLEELTFHESVMIGKGENVVLHTRLTRQFLKNSVEITGKSDDTKEVVLASANAEFLAANTVTDTDIQIPKWDVLNTVSGSEIYKKKRGIYDEKIHLIQEYFLSDNTAWLRVSIPVEYMEERTYFINPYVLDAALLGRVAFCKEAEEKSIPLYIKKVYFFHMLSGEEYSCKVDMLNQTKKMWEGNVSVYGKTGELCILLEGVLCIVQEEKEQNFSNERGVLPVKVSYDKRETIRREIINSIQAVTVLDSAQIKEETSFIHMGITSVQLVQLAKELSSKFSLEIHPALLFEYSCLDSLISYLTKQKLDVIETGEKAKPELSQKKEYGTEVAIIGLSGIMPDSNDLEEFWKHLLAGKYMIKDAPASRFAHDMEQGKIRRGAFIKQYEEFDASFFDISPREAELMDPQQRICLQLAWKAIEDAGYNPKNLAGSDTAVMIGVAGHDYSNVVNQGKVPSYAQALLGNSHNILTGRISYFMDWHGQSEPIDCACASALVAIHRGAECIRNGTSQMALAGGVNLLADGYLYDAFDNIGILSKSGICNPFDEQADGTIRGEGAGMILLKSLEQAERDGDHIYAVIKGSSVNHDGRSSSLTAPNGSQQKEAIKKAHFQADINPSTISYIEAHGTGTQIGDSIEVEAIKNAYQELYQEWNLEYKEENRCGIGTVKSNIGHLESAAGMAGLLKVILCMKEKKLTGLVNLKNQNPLIQLENTPFYLVRETQEWERRVDEAGNEIPFRAEIHSFGLSGVNSCLILEEYKEKQKEEQPQQDRLVCISARSKNALQEMAFSLLVYAKECSEKGRGDLEEVSYTLLTGRQAWNYRIAFIVNSFQELIDKLEGYLNGKADIEGMYGPKDEKENTDWIPIFDKDMIRALAIHLTERRKLDKLAKLWISGLDIQSWSQLYERQPFRVSVPTYPFEHTKYWFEGIQKVTAKEGVITKEEQIPLLMESSICEDQQKKEMMLKEKLRKIIAEISGFTMDEIEENADLNEYGFDSVSYTELSNYMNEIFHTNITPADFYELSELTIDSLIQYIE